MSGVVVGLYLGGLGVLFFGLLVFCCYFFRIVLLVVLV